MSLFLTNSGASLVLANGGVVRRGGNTINAASASQADVQAKIDEAANGDTVMVPAGSATWTTPVTISGKRLTLTGAGAGITTIRDDTTGYDNALVVTASAVNFVEINGFSFVKVRANNNGMVVLNSTVGESGFRFHHNVVDSGVQSGGLGILVLSGYGLIDNTTFISLSKQMLSVYGSNPSTDGGYTPWTYPLDAGTANALYVEDCTFSGGADDDIIDAYSGARLVIRHNTFTNCAVGFHGTDTGGHRGPVLHELYENVFTNNVSPTRRAVTSRGGTSLYFNNSYSGDPGYIGFVLQYLRATLAYTRPSSYGQCDGTLYDIGSTNFSTDASRTAVTYGTVARFLASNPDIVCTGSTSGDCSRGIDGSGLRGYPGRDQPGRGPNGQQLNPVYEWNNNSGTLHTTTYDAGCESCGGYPMSTWIAENRDYYNHAASFNGSVGVGYGLLSERPASGLTAGVGYFATDTNTLYVATNATTWAVYYTPYTYPHPLQS